MEFSHGMIDLPKDRDVELEKKISDVFIEQYRHAWTLQRVGKYREAFCEYKLLLPLIANEPMLWVRLTECSLYVLYEFAIQSLPFNIRALATDPALARVHIIDDFSYLRDVNKEKTAASEISMEFAEMAITTAMVLTKTSENMLLKKHIAAQASFVMLKTGRFRQAEIYAHEVLQTAIRIKDSPIVGNYLDIFAHLLKIECLLKYGIFELAYKNLQTLDIEINDDTSQVSVNDKWVLYERIVALCGMEDWEAAKDEYLKMITVFFPRHAFALGAYIFTYCGDFDEFRKIMSNVNFHERQPPLPSTLKKPSLDRSTPVSDDSPDAPVHKKKR